MVERSMPLKMMNLVLVVTSTMETKNNWFVIRRVHDLCQTGSRAVQPREMARPLSTPRARMGSSSWQKWNVQPTVRTPLLHQPDWPIHNWSYPLVWALTLWVCMEIFMAPFKILAPAIETRDATKRDALATGIRVK